MKMLQGEVNRGPASRQAGAGRAPAHEEQFGLKGTLGTCGATGVAGSVHGSGLGQWPGVREELQRHPWKWQVRWLGQDGRHLESSEAVFTQDLPDLAPGR